MRNGRPDGPEVLELNTLLAECGALGRARARALEYAQAALGELRAFPESPSRRALEAVPDLMILRDR
jgi:geranylgeranyl pyrophosphate synthase